MEKNELIEGIKALRKQKNAVILAHYYTIGDIQDLADYVGDSLGLAQQAAKSDADIIVMCGVHFMGETCKILCPEKKVLAISSPSATLSTFFATEPATFGFVDVSSKMATFMRLPLSAR